MSRAGSLMRGDPRPRCRPMRTQRQPALGAAGQAAQPPARPLRPPSAPVLEPKASTPQGVEPPPGRRPHDDLHRRDFVREPEPPWPRPSSTRRNPMVTLQRPDKLRVIQSGDGPALRVLLRRQDHGRVRARRESRRDCQRPSDVDAALEAAYDSAAIYFPFTDVMVADPYEDIAEALELAFYIGQSGWSGERRQTSWPTPARRVRADVGRRRGQAAPDGPRRLPQRSAAVASPGGLLRLETRRRRFDGRLRILERRQGQAIPFAHPDPMPRLSEDPPPRASRRKRSRRHGTMEDDRRRFVRVSWSPRSRVGRPSPGHTRAAYGSASGGDGSWSGSGYRGGSASGGGGSWSGTGYRGGTASGSDGSSTATAPTAAVHRTPRGRARPRPTRTAIPPRMPRDQGRRPPPTPTAAPRRTPPARARRRPTNTATPRRTRPGREPPP